MCGLYAIVSTVLIAWLAAFYEDSLGIDRLVCGLYTIVSTVLITWLAAFYDDSIGIDSPVWGLSLCNRLHSIHNSGTSSLFLTKTALVWTALCVISMR